MEQLIIDSIIKKLYMAFPEIPAYDDLIRWDDSGEAFFVSITATERTPNLGALNRDTILLDVLYDPGVDQPDAKCRKMDTLLKDIVEYIPRVDREGRYFQSKNIRTNTVDGLLHVTFSIDIYKTKIWEAETIERINLTIKEKNSCHSIPKKN